MWRRPAPGRRAAWGVRLIGHALRLVFIHSFIHSHSDSSVSDGSLLDHFLVFECLRGILVLLVRMESPRAVLWRPEALDCREPIPPEAWSWLTRNPPSLGNLGPPACRSLATGLLVQLRSTRHLALFDFGARPIRAAGNYGFTVV